MPYQPVGLAGADIRMKFAVQVNGSPYGSEAGDSAYQFIRAAIGQGHEFACVFFYHEGACQGSERMQPPADEADPVERWSDLARHGIDLVICISAAQRRGIGAPVEAVRPAEWDSALASGFRIGGLGLWVDACLKSDRVLVFRD